MTSALQQLILASRPSTPAPAPVTSGQLYRETLRNVKYPTYDGTRSQDKVNDFLNLFSVVKGLNGLTDTDLIRLVIQHLRGLALLWWVELSETNKAQRLPSSWSHLKDAFCRQFIQWNATSTDTQSLIYSLRQVGSARSYFTQLRQLRMRIPPIPESLLFHIVYATVQPHCRAALVRLQQLKPTDDIVLDEIEDECTREDDAESARSIEQLSTMPQPQTLPPFPYCLIDPSLLPKLSFHNSPLENLPHLLTATLLGRLPQEEA